MKPDKDRLDFFRIAGLKPKRIPPELKKYASFNRRMWAATIDSVILLFFYPVIETVFSFFYPQVDVDFSALAEKARMQTDQHESSRIFWQGMVESGFVDRWLSSVCVQMSVYLVFSAICWRLWSATPGKMVMRIRLADSRTEGKISDLQIGLRLIGYVISALPFLLGFFWIAFSKHRQGWHDRLANTVVIALPWKQQEKSVISDSQAADRSSSPGPSTTE